MSCIVIGGLPRLTSAFGLNDCSDATTFLKIGVNLFSNVHFVGLITATAPCVLWA